MNNPDAKVIAAFKALKCNDAFEAIMDWIRANRDARDAENRIKGAENRTSEAHALSHILEVRDVATRAPAADNGRNEHEVTPGYIGAG